MTKLIFNRLHLLLLAAFYLIGTTSLSAQSKAHESSKFAIIDPSYNASRLTPASDIQTKATTWIYGPSELECYRLQLLIARKDSAKLNVGYTGAFHKPYKEGSFRLKLSKPLNIKAIEFRITGSGKLFINEKYASDFIESNSNQTIKLKESSNILQIRFDALSSKDLPGLLVLTKGITTDDLNWEWKTTETDWEYAHHFPQTKLNVPPHKLEDPAIKLNPVSVKDNLYDFGREILGYIFIQSEAQPVFGAGESTPEALNRNVKAQEQSLELTSLSKGLWKTKYPVAFRFVSLQNNQPASIWTEAIYRPETYKGAFACSDSMITRIWMNSAYTLRLCMHDFLLDGIKRDRLPWAGDLAMSSLVDAYTFYDQELVRRSLVALGREGIKETDINGIVDFSLWWIISQDQYQLYFGDSAHLTHEWNRIKETMNTLEGTCDSTGFLIPRKGARLFLDWVKQEKWTSLQIIWWWTQTSYARLAERVGDHAAANNWLKRADKLKEYLWKAAWSEKEQRWLSRNDSISEKTRHPDFLAVVSSLSDQNQYPGIKTFLHDTKVKSVGSPYMSGFETMALGRMGDMDYMLKHVKEYWGDMINKGATTFWEAYNERDSKDRQYSFYSRPFGKSLCHAWSSGPAAFLPMELFGLKPLEDGWKRFTISPNIGSLQWASVCVPTKYGNITVDIVKDNIQVSIPQGTILDWNGNSIAGPKILKGKL